MGFGTKNCKFCAAPIELKIKRDLHRKVFCSVSCRQKWRCANGLVDWSISIRAMNTPEVNLKKRNFGHKNSKWLPNRNTKGRQRPESKAWKEAVLARDNHTCVFCGSRDKVIADHIKPWAFYKSLRFDIDNGRSLCESCHRKTETYGAKARLFAKQEGVI